MSHSLNGGCLCGAVRYQAQLEKLEAYYCHCRMCQLAFGNIFATFVNVLKADVTWPAGEPRYFASSKLARRGFCGQCGTPLTFAYHDSERMDLSVGSLDHPEALHPTAHFAVETRLAPFHVPDGLKEQRLDEFTPIVKRWQAHYGADFTPGPRPDARASAAAVGESQSRRP